MRPLSAGFCGALCPQVPRICFVNKMDRLGADFYNCVKMVISNLGAKPCVLQVRPGPPAGVLLWRGPAFAQ